ncbi:hypothetical protein FRC05_001293 [Tulasnella sp. 425]|nr:hypothetical protein FRC05_001293 [Tulasnella sp. 425]
MPATIDGTESLSREATLSDSLISQTTEPDTSQRRASNGSLFIHRLPTEIFIHLIALVLADHRPDSNPAEVYTRIGELKLVCVLWADRINSYPGFWNVLTNRRGPRLVSAVLRRSRAVPLYVEIIQVPVPDQDIHAYITVIKSYAHRWTTFTINCCGVNEAALRDLLQVPAPQLQKLSIAGWSFPPTTAIQLFGGQAPLLHTAIITAEEWSIIRPIIPRLKHLVVGPNRFPSGLPTQLTFNRIMQALTASPEIEVLKFCNLLGSALLAEVEDLTVPSNPIILSHLRSITLYGVSIEVGFGFLTRISFPRDCAVNIYVDVMHSPVSPTAVFSILYARFTQVAPLGIDIKIRPWCICVVLSYERDGAGRVEITVNWSVTEGLRRKGLEHVLRQLGEAIRASSMSVHLRIGRQETDGTFPCETYKSIVEMVDDFLPSTTRASIYGLHLTEFINYAKSGFVNLSELVIEEMRVVAPWMQLVELAKSRSGQAADPGARVAALKSISLPSKGLDEVAREELSRVVGQVNWTEDPDGTRFTLRARAGWQVLKCFPPSPLKSL